MAQPIFQPQAQYAATTVTLAAANTKYNLWALVQAQRANAPQSAREVNVQVSSSQGAKIWFGDGLMTENDYGFVLSASDGLAQKWRSAQGNMIWGHIFVMTDTVGALLSVEVIGC